MSNATEKMDPILRQVPVRRECVVFGGMPCVVGGMRVWCAGGMCGSPEIFVIFLILGRVGVPYIFLGHKDTNTLLS